MSSFRESRYRNIVAPDDIRRRGSSAPLSLIAILAGAFILVCCGCAGLLVGLQVSGAGGPLVDKLSSSMARPTPTVDKNAPIPLKTKGAADNGLEMTVVSVQRPLKIQGNVPLPPDQEFILVSVQITNTKKTGNPINIAPADFKVKGDGGLTYDANPSTVKIDKLLTQTTIAPARKLDAELIYQIAVDDSGLKLYWRVGGATKIYLLEKQ